MLRRRFLIWGSLLYIAMAFVPWLVTNPYHLRLVNIALIRAVAVLGLNFVTGLTGQISIAQAGFFGLGAYASALLVLKAGLPFWAGLVGSITLSALAGLAIGIPTLKLRGPYLAFATIGVGAILQLVFINWSSLTGGPQGLKSIPPASFGLPKLWGGAPLVLQGDVRAFYFIALVLLLAVGLQAALLASKYGRAFTTLMSSDVAAEAIGINTTALKTLAFTLGSVYGGLAGSLYAHLVGYISPDSFGMDAGILFITMLIVGGSGTVLGSVLGPILVTFLPEWLRFLKEPYMLVYSASVLAVLLFVPEGLVGLTRRMWAAVRRERTPLAEKEVT